MNTKHELKVWPAQFFLIQVGMKKAEFRKNDRGFEMGDVLHLREWDPQTEKYTGAELYRLVSDITTGFGIPEGYCMMSLGW